MEPLVIYIDASEYSVVVFCGECETFKEIYTTACKAKEAGRNHRDTQHKYRGINTITIHSE